MHKIIEFQNTQIPCVIDSEGIIWVAIKPICESIGLNIDAAARSIRNEEILALVHTTQYVPDARKHTQKMICLPLDYLNGWLFSINTKLVSKEAKPNLIQYKKECYKFLFNHFFGSKKTPEGHERQWLETVNQIRLNKEEIGQVMKTFYETEEGQRVVTLKKENKDLKKHIKVLKYEGMQQLGMFDTAKLQAYAQ